MLTNSWLKMASGTLAQSKKLNIGRQVGHTVSVRGKVIESFDTKTVDRDGTKPAPRGILNISRIKLVQHDLHGVRLAHIDETLKRLQAQIEQASTKYDYEQNFRF